MGTGPRGLVAVAVQTIERRDLGLAQERHYPQVSALNTTESAKCGPSGAVVAVREGSEWRLDQDEIQNLVRVCGGPSS